MIEIEKRGLLSEEQYNEVTLFLNSHAESLEDDDKDLVYYIYDDKLLKVVQNISKRTAKVSLKMNTLGGGPAAQETEVFFNFDDFSNIKYIFDTIGNHRQVITGVQKRKNFLYKGCEIAVKWSNDYGYHFEIEKLTDTKENIKNIEEEIEVLAQELKLTLLSEAELQEFQRKVEESKTAPK